MINEQKPMVELINITKRFGDIEAVKDVSLKIYEGEFITLLGPSGCGKTTTLRMIGGFEQPDQGDVLINGISVKGKKPFEIDVNTVFQSYALFPHMTVYQNIAFGLKMKKIKEKEYRPRAEKALALVKMDEYADRVPKQLSGGEQQRIAVARAIVNNPRVLLLDEPLGALDLKLRKQMQVELKELQKRLGMTFIYVTHDQEEALVMSDRIAVMNQGLIEQVDSPTNIYRYPRSRFVADFIGDTNLLECTLVSLDNDLAILDHQGTRLYGYPHTDSTVTKNKLAYLSIRPEDISIIEGPNEMAGETVNADYAEQIINCIPAVVEDIIFVGAVAKLVINTKTAASFKLIAHASLSSGSALLGKNVYVSWQPEQSVFITE